MKPTPKKFHYSNVQHSQHGGKKTVRKVMIKNGKGYKSVSLYTKGKLIKTAKKPLSVGHIEMIQQNKFIPKLFADCTIVSMKKGTRKLI